MSLKHPYKNTDQLEGQLADQLGIASALAIPCQTAIPMNEMQEVCNPMSDRLENFEDTALAIVGYEGYSTDEDDVCALVAESGKKQSKLRKRSVIWHNSKQLAFPDFPFDNAFALARYPLRWLFSYLQGSAILHEANRHRVMLMFLLLEDLTCQTFSIVIDSPMDRRFDTSQGGCLLCGFDEIVFLHDDGLLLDMPYNNRTVIRVVLLAGFGPGQEPTAAENRLLKGRKFHSWQEFDNALDEYEASSGTVVRRIYRSKTVFTGRCRGWSKDHPDACKMELCARLMKKTGLITIRRVYLIHTCIQEIHKWRNGRNRARWVARKVMRIVKVNRDTTIEQLQQDLREYHMADSKQWSVQRARMACREKLGGGHRESFSQIPSYASRLQQSDPGVHVTWHVSDSQNFERIFIAPSSSQHAFQFCRPIVGLDGTHTSGDYPMIILLATCHDGENNIVTLAWAIAPIENSENWSWFLKELRVCYPSLPERGIFISDRDKGLKTAVAQVFPDNLHSYCVQHIKAQLKAITDLDCVAYFEKVVAAKSRVEFEELLNEFDPQSEKQSALIPYVRKLDPTLYARHAFPSPRYGHTASNVVEVVNAAIRPNRKLPALLLCHEMWLYCMETHFKRKQHGDGLPSEALSLTDTANDMLSKLTIESNSVKERTSSLDQALMVDRDGSYALRVPQKHCDCMDWQEMQFPCAHLVAFERDKGRDVRQHADKSWLASNYKQTYSMPVAPISIDRLDTDKSCGEPHIDPDLKKKQQHRKKRLPSRRDNLLLECEARVRKQNQKCSGCKKSGHNLRRCPFTLTNAADEGTQLLPAVNVEPLDAINRLEDPSQDPAMYQNEPKTFSYSEW